MKDTLLIAHDTSKCCTQSSNYKIAHAYIQSEVYGNIMEIHYKSLVFIPFWPIIFAKRFFRQTHEPDSTTKP